MERAIVYESVRDGKIRRNWIAGVIVIVALLGLAVGAAFYFKYTPPSHDENAKEGVPVVEQDYLYDMVVTDMDYDFSMASNLYQQKDQSLKVYFTNSSENKVYLMVKVYEKDGEKLLYESGVLYPGEYVEKLEPADSFGNKKMDVLVRIYAFNPKTYESEGTTELELTLQPW